jgi:hypothetical protein
MAPSSENLSVRVGVDSSNYIGRFMELEQGTAALFDACNRLSSSAAARADLSALFWFAVVVCTVSALSLACVIGASLGGWR